MRDPESLACMPLVFAMYLRDVRWSLIFISTHATGASKYCTVDNPSRSAQIHFAPAQRLVVLSFPPLPIPELVGTCRWKFRDRDRATITANCGHVNELTMFISRTTFASRNVFYTDPPDCKINAPDEILTFPSGFQLFTIKA